MSFYSKCSKTLARVRINKNVGAKSDTRSVKSGSR